MVVRRVRNQVGVICHEVIATFSFAFAFVSGVWAVVHQVVTRSAYPAFQNLARGLGGQDVGSFALARRAGRAKPW